MHSCGFILLLAHLVDDSPCPWHLVGTKTWPLETGSSFHLCPWLRYSILFSWILESVWNSSSAWTSYFHTILDSPHGRYEWSIPPHFVFFNFFCCSSTQETHSQYSMIKNIQSWQSQLWDRGPCSLVWVLSFHGLEKGWLSPHHLHRCLARFLADVVTREGSHLCSYLVQYWTTHICHARSLNVYTWCYGRRNTKKISTCAPYDNFSR